MKYNQHGQMIEQDLRIEVLGIWLALVFCTLAAIVPAFYANNWSIDDHAVEVQCKINKCNLIEDLR